MNANQDYIQYIDQTNLWMREILMRRDGLSKRRSGSEWPYPRLSYRRRVADRLWRIQHPESLFPRQVP